MFISRPQPTSGALYSEEDFVILTTTEKEKYKCLLPSLTAGEEVSTPNTFWEWHSCLSKELWELVTELVCTSRARHGAILCCFCTGDYNLPADVRKKDKLWYSCVKKVWVIPQNSSGPEVVWSMWYVQTVTYNMWTALFANRFFFIFISSKLS